MVLAVSKKLRFPSSSPFPFNPAAILGSRRFRNMGRSYDYSIQSVRQRVLGDVLRGCVVPAGAILFALRLVGIKLGYASSALVFPLAASSGSYLLSLYKHNVDSQEAKRLGANSALFQYLRERLLSFYRRAIVVVPGLIDFSVFFWRKEYEESYLGISIFCGES